MNYMQYPAHVGHPVSHTPDTARVGLTIAAVLIATVVVVYTGGTALLAIAPALEAAGTIAAAGSVAMAAGNVIDSASARSAECYIQTGLPTVLLGPLCRPAARADAPETKTTGWHEIKVAEGSKLVMLGPEFKPMSRKGDRIDEGCGGVIMDGVRNIFVGGDPSKLGIPISEADSGAVQAITMTLDIMGATSTIAKGGAANLVRGTAQGAAIAIGGDEGKVLKALGTGAPGSVLESVDAANTVFDGGRGAVNVTTRMTGGRPTTPGVRPPSADGTPMD